jgi:diguanylate cyclase (GGDEF)-like protein
MAELISLRPRAGTDRRHTPGAPSRARRRAAVAYGVLTALLLAYAILKALAPAHRVWLDGWAMSGFEVLASLLAMAAALTLRRDRIVPLLLGGGLLLWAAGDLVSTGLGSPASPSPADAFYVAFYPVTYVGVMMLVRRKIRHVTGAAWLDGAVAGLGAAAVCAQFAFPTMLSAAGGGATTVATDLVYPIGDLLLLALVIGASALVSGHRRTRWLLLAVGYLINAAGDTANLFGATGPVGAFLDAVAWPVSSLVVSGALWLPVPRSLGSDSERAPGLLLPGSAAGAALIILVLASWRHHGQVALGLAAGTLVLAGLRAGLSLRGLRTLTEHRREQANTDELTRLANRRALFERLEHLLAEPGSLDQPRLEVALLFVDLDRFKEVNDSFGHSVGDHLLRQLGGRLTGALRASDLLVRMGGDEFVVVLPGAGSDYAVSVAERISARLGEPFQLGDVQARVGASIGIAVAADGAHDAATLVRRADTAMYRAKTGGKNLAIYHEAIDGDGDRLGLVEDLRHAIETSAVHLHFQPQIEISSGRVLAVEALARWRHPRLGDVPPLEFLPLAEDAGLMAALTACVIDQALGACADWWHPGRRVAVAVNISVTNLLDPAFRGAVERALAAHELPVEALVLEVTETTAMSDFDHCKRAIQELSDLGLCISVDDFGAGFTSLAYLSSLAVDELKLDRLFISGLGLADPGSRDLALVRSTIELAHSIGLRVVAEGVEDARTLGLLTEFGCDLAQGYLLGRPLPLAELRLDPRAVPRRAQIAAPAEAA